MRPTKYKKEYCDKVVKMMRKGMSIEEVCYELEIAKQTFYNWCDTHPEFMDAKKRGVDFSCGWWKKQGRENLKEKEFNATLFYMNMKNRFGWADKQETKQETSSKIEIKVDKQSDLNIDDFLND